MFTISMSQFFPSLSFVLYRKYTSSCYDTISVPTDAIYPRPGKPGAVTVRGLEKWIRPIFIRAEMGCRMCFETSKWWLSCYLSEAVIRAYVLRS